MRQLFGNTVLSLAVCCGLIAAANEYLGINFAVFAFLSLYYAQSFPEKYIPPLFTVLYGAYCSKVIGYNLRHKFHPRHQELHSSFTNGVRHISTRPSTFTVKSPALPDFGFVVVPVPILNDNYAYLLISGQSKQCAVIDPADPNRVVDFLALLSKQYNVDLLLTHVFVTHKHWDHAGGNDELSDLAEKGTPHVSKELKIIGSTIDNPDACNAFIDDKETITVCANIHIRALASPGHTIGSLMFLAAATDETVGGESERTALFTGDCIFCGGCGAQFEAKQVGDVLKTHDVFLSNVITSNASGQQVPSTHVFVYVGHEYSERLYRELAVPLLKKRDTGELNRREQMTIKKFDAMLELRRAKELFCTVPSTLSEERYLNPLLSLERSVLEELEHQQLSGKRIHTEVIENAIYTSPRRKSDEVGIIC